jgi:hypothetical protein
MNGNIRPPVVITKFFKERDLFGLSLDEIEQKLMDAVIEDPELEDTTNISIDIEDKGAFKEHLVHIIGKVKTKDDKDRVQEIVEKNTRKELKISNELAVEA